MGEGGVVGVWRGLAYFKFKNQNAKIKIREYL